MQQNVWTLRTKPPHYAPYSIPNSRRNRKKPNEWPDQLYNYEIGRNGMQMALESGSLPKKLQPFHGKHTFFSLLPPFLTSAVISRFISGTRWLFHISKHHPKYNNQKESEKINQCPQTTDQFWQVRFIHKSYSSLGILLSCIHNALDSDDSSVSARWQPRWEDTHCSIRVALFP